MSIGGPLFQLRWFGTICPCLEKSQDCEARQALISFGNKRVKWHRGSGGSSGGKGSSGLGGFVSGLFSGSTNSDNVVEAKLRFVDTSNGPQLHVVPSSSPLLSMNTMGTANGDGNGNGANQPTMNQSAGYMKTISLKKIDKAVTTGNNTFKLQSETRDSLETLVKLELLDDDEDSMDKVIECFTQIIEWDGRRRASQPEQDEYDEEEEFQSGIKARAQKAAHFAKREIEMKQQKREREKRKERYMKDSGGLKYTAIAMANREA